MGRSLQRDRLSHPGAKQYHPYVNSPSTCQRIFEIACLVIILASGPAWLGGVYSIFITGYGIALGLLGLLSFGTRRHLLKFLVLAVLFFIFVIVVIILNAIDPIGKNLPFYDNTLVPAGFNGAGAKRSFNSDFEKRTDDKPTTQSKYGCAYRNCTLSLRNVGQLSDGQLRLGYGTGASPVFFTLRNGTLVDDQNRKCYISSQTQLQCNSPPQTQAYKDFCVGDNAQLSYKNSTAWWSCDAGTGGANLYNTKFYSHCTPVNVTVVNTDCFDFDDNSKPDNGTDSPGNNNPSTSPDLACRFKNCTASLNNVGQLSDGTLRHGFGSGASAVSFKLRNGTLTDDKNRRCHITSQNQVLCSSPTQTSEWRGFCVGDNNRLSFKNSTSFWSCDAGTGGADIFITKYYDYCQPLNLTVTDTECSLYDETAPDNTEDGGVVAPAGCAYQNCTLGLNLGQRNDGDLRFGSTDQYPSTLFTLRNNSLVDSQRRRCYLSSSSQLICNSPRTTNDFRGFCVNDLNQLTYLGSNQWWSCYGAGAVFARNVDSSCVLTNLTVANRTCSDFDASAADVDGDSGLVAGGGAAGDGDFVGFFTGVFVGSRIVTYVTSGILLAATALAAIAAFLVASEFRPAPGTMTHTATTSTTSAPVIPVAAAVPAAVAPAVFVPAAFAPAAAPAAFAPSYAPVGTGAPLVAAPNPAAATGVVYAPLAATGAAAVPAFAAAAAAATPAYPVEGAPAPVYVDRGVVPGLGSTTTAPADNIMFEQLNRAVPPTHLGAAVSAPAPIAPTVYGAVPVMEAPIVPVATAVPVAAVTAVPVAYQTVVGPRTPLMRASYDN